GSVLRRTFRLNFLRVENTVRAHAAIGQRLRTVLERVRQRIAAFIGYIQGQLVLNEDEFDDTVGFDDGLRLDIAADPQVPRLGRGANLIELGNGLVIALRARDPRRGQPD